jgi:hypothetical protein
MEEKLQNQQRNKLEVFFGSAILIRPRAMCLRPNVWMTCSLDNASPYGSSLIRGGGGVLYAAHVSGKVSEAWVTPGGLQGTQGYSSFCDQLL